MTKKRPAIGTTPVKSRVPVDVTNATFKANPFPFYAQLRAASPVFLVKLPTKQHAWLITRYDDVLNVLKDERFAKDSLISSPTPPSGEATPSSWMSALRRGFPFTLGCTWMRSPRMTVRDAL